MNKTTRVRVQGHRNGLAMVAPRRLDAADAAHLEEHGFCVVRGLFDPDLCAEARAMVDRFSAIHRPSRWWVASRARGRTTTETRSS